MSGLLIDALGGMEGLTITVRHELPEPSMRLMGTLGVTVLVDPSAPPCARPLYDPRVRERRPCELCEAVEAAIGTVA